MSLTRQRRAARRSRPPPASPSRPRPERLRHVDGDPPRRRPPGRRPDVSMSTIDDTTTSLLRGLRHAVADHQQGQSGPIPMGTCPQLRGRQPVQAAARPGSSPTSTTCSRRPSYQPRSPSTSRQLASAPPDAARRRRPVAGGDAYLQNVQVAIGQQLLGGVGPVQPRTARPRSSAARSRPQDWLNDHDARHRPGRSASRSTAASSARPRPDVVPAQRAGLPGRGRAGQQPDPRLHRGPAAVAGLRLTSALTGRPASRSWTSSPTCGGCVASAPGSGSRPTGRSRATSRRRPHETLEAIDSGDADHLREELGDLLLQVVLPRGDRGGGRRLHPRRRRARDRDKMRRRNPHVFGPTAAPTGLSAAEVNEQWQADQGGERTTSRRDAPSPYDGIAATLPALLLATKILERVPERGGRAARAGDRRGRPRRPPARPGRRGRRARASTPSRPSATPCAAPSPADPPPSRRERHESCRVGAQQTVRNRAELSRDDSAVVGRRAGSALACERPCIRPAGAARRRRGPRIV